MSTSVNDVAETWTVDSWPVDEGASHVDDTPPLAWPVDEGPVVIHDPPQPATASQALVPGAAAAEGVSGRGLVVLSAVAAAAIAGFDLWITQGRLSFFFDLCFVVLCLVAAMAVRRSDLFTAGVLPPLLFGGVIAAVAVLAPSAFEAAARVDKVFLTGLAGHASGLVAGYAVALLTVAARTAASRA